jgi:hypothetical protein
MSKYFVVIFGPGAVGKMTVGYELQKLTGLKLFHNHMSIDFVLNFFPWGDPHFHKLNRELRVRILEEIAASDLAGAIFTYVWALDQPGDKKEIDAYGDIFRTRGGRVLYVELFADQKVRLERNVTEFRLAQKTPKRDIEKSTEALLEHDDKYRLNSDGDFFYKEDHLRIDNTNLSAADAAAVIARHFSLPLLPKGRHPTR